jgi:hypothetical protein
VSVWASILGEDPNLYMDGYGDDDQIEGFMDVAVSCVADRVRIICESANEGTVVLDPAGLVELHRRIVQARIQLARREAEWRRQQQP